MKRIQHIKNFALCFIFESTFKKILYLNMSEKLTKPSFSNFTRFCKKKLCLASRIELADLEENTQICSRALSKIIFYKAISISA